MKREELLEHCYQIVEDHLKNDIQMSARNVYYKLVGRGLIPQDDEGERKSYRKVIDTIAKAKLAGAFPLNWLQDNLRVPRPGKIAGGLADTDEVIDEIVDYLAWFPKSLIKIDKWYGQPVVPFVMVEKDTLEGTVRGPCRTHDVPLYVSRGYSSITGLYAWANQLAEVSAEADWEFDVEVLYLGDHDPEGMNIPEAIEKVVRQLVDLKGWHNFPEFSVRRVALTMDQALAGGFPPMKVKTKSARAGGYIKKYGTQAWEIEAMDAMRLRDMLNDEITALWDPVISASFDAEIRARRAELKHRLITDAHAIMERALRQ